MCKKEERGAFYKRLGRGLGLRGFWTLLLLLARPSQAKAPEEAWGGGCAFVCLALQQKFPSSFSQSSAGCFLCFLRSLRDLWWWRWW